MSVQRCKGTQDMCPGDMEVFRRIEAVFRDCCLKRGYEEVRTPTLEYLHLFTSTGTLTPGRLGKVYSFLDWDGWSGERVVLRPDGTIPIARLFVQDMADAELAKLFYVTNVFIFDETGKDTREKWQCGAELIGAGGATADVALMVLAMTALRQLGLKNVELRLSHAGIIRTLLATCGLDAEEQEDVFDRILDGDEEILAKTKSERPELGKTLAPLLKLKGRSSGFLKNLSALFKQDVPELAPALNEFVGIVDLLEEVGVKYKIDITSGRGFEYYTGSMFRLLVDGEHVGGGGRYDDLIPLLGGRDIPACGFALYFDKLMALMAKDISKGEESCRVMVKAGDGSLREAFKLVESLQKHGCIAEVYLGGPDPVGVNWLVEIGDEAPAFHVTGGNGGAHELKTGREVLDLIKG